MDLKLTRDKLVGSEEQRAVSPVIGVILMVAITVILAAVIAAFVLDMGSGLQDSAQAGVNVEAEGTASTTVTVESLANADKVEIRDNSGTAVTTLTSVGETATNDGGALSDDTSYSAVALFEDDTGANTIATFETGS